MKLFTPFSSLGVMHRMAIPDGDAGSTGSSGGTSSTEGPAAGGTAATAPEKTFSQAEVDKIVTDRIARERKKTPNVDELKEKAQKWDQQQAESMTEVEKLKLACDAANAAKLDAEAKVKAAETRVTKTALLQKAGIPMELIDRVRGETEEEILADIELLKPLITTAQKKVTGGMFPAGTTTPTPEAGAYGTELAKRFKNAAPKSNFFTR